MSGPQRNKPVALGSLLASSRDAAARYAGIAIDHEQWRQLVGERIAARTEPGSMRGRELTVHVATSSWAQELSLFEKEIVGRLVAKGIKVDRLRFRVKEIAARPRDPAARAPAYRKAALPNALNTELERIEDPELRDAIGEAAALWLALDDTPAKTRASSRPKAGAAPAPQSARPSAPTSARPDARALRAAESQSARSGRTPESARATPKGKP
ncbi:MAG TPA: DciA family protein [Polyangiaceae bacterium]|nr:DciA family protein [Polyangiaceae bacterium]